VKDMANMTSDEERIKARRPRTSYKDALFIAIH
jgi:hypothetical protein